jgi:hypothetical protein
MVERFTEKSPMNVMAREALENALAPEALDKLFDTDFRGTSWSSVRGSPAVRHSEIHSCYVASGARACYHDAIDSAHAHPGSAGAR